MVWPQVIDTAWKVHTRKVAEYLKKLVTLNFNLFGPADFAKKRVLKLLERFPVHCPAIKS